MLSPEIIKNYFNINKISLFALVQDFDHFSIVLSFQLSILLHPLQSSSSQNFSTMSKSMRRLLSNLLMFIFLCLNTCRRDTNEDDWAKWKELKPNAVPSILATKILPRPVVKHQATLAKSNSSLLGITGGIQHPVKHAQVFECDKAISSNSHLSL